MNDTAMNEIVTRYIDCWNASGEQRCALVEKTFTTDAVYIDPLTEARGRDEIGATIGGVQAQFPGMTFRLLGTIDAHHQQVRFRWGLGADGAEPLAEGFDVAVAAADGRLERVYGFLDKIPG